MEQHNKFTGSYNSINYTQNVLASAKDADSLTNDQLSSHRNSINFRKFSVLTATAIIPAALYYLKFQNAAVALSIFPSYFAWKKYLFSRKFNTNSCTISQANDSFNRHVQSIKMANMPLNKIVRSNKERLAMNQYR